MPVTKYQLYKRPSHVQSRPSHVQRKPMASFIFPMTSCVLHCSPFHGVPSASPSAPASSRWSSGRAALQTLPAGGLCRVPEAMLSHEAYGGQCAQTVQSEGVGRSRTPMSPLSGFYCVPFGTRFFSRACPGHVQRKLMASFFFQ